MSKSRIGISFTFPRVKMLPRVLKKNMCALFNCDLHVELWDPLTLIHSLIAANPVGLLVCQAQHFLTVRSGAVLPGSPPSPGLQVPWRPASPLA